MGLIAPEHIILQSQVESVKEMVLKKLDEINKMQGACNDMLTALNFPLTPEDREEIRERIEKIRRDIIKLY